jgi:uncharacterized membrane protein YbhN (UPF0104 family)
MLVRSNLTWNDLLGLQWGMVIVAVLLFQVWYFLRGWIWMRLLDEVGNSIQVGNVGKVGNVLPRISRLRQWVASELLRYIPGNVWSFVGRYKGAKDAGSETKPAIATIVTEAWILVVGAAVIATFALRNESYGQILGLGTALFGLAPLYVKRFFTIQQRTLFSLALLSIANWAIYGLAFAILFRAMPNAPTISLPLLIGTNVAAWLLGYLSLITPMGLGVREAVLIQLLGDFGVTNGIAAFAAAVGRVLLILGEGLFYLIVILVEGISKRKRLETIG